MPLSAGRYNEHDNATHITGGEMTGPGHVHITVHGPRSQIIAEKIVSMWNAYEKWEHAANRPIDPNNPEFC